MASMHVFVLQGGCRYEGMSVLSVHDTLSGAKGSCPLDSGTDYVICETPINGKPVKSWRNYNRELRNYNRRRQGLEGLAREWQLE